MQQLWILAFDHRNSLRTQFFKGRDVSADDCRRAKEIAFDGLLMAVEAGIPVGTPSLLIDDEYGADVARRAREAGITVAIPLERSGQRELSFEHVPLYSAIVDLDPQYAKILVRYNPDGDLALNARQRERLLEAQAWLHANQKEMMLELLIPPEQKQRTRLGAAYDADIRPALAVRAVRELIDAGLDPALWKLEGCHSRSDYEAIVAEVDRAPRPDAGCLVLGRGADAAAVDRWLSLAAPVRGFVGFAVGRTLWWKPLAAHFAGQSSARDAAADICSNYQRLISVYRGACGEGTS